MVNCSHKMYKLDILSTSDIIKELNKEERMSVSVVQVNKCKPDL